MKKLLLIAVIAMSIVSCKKEDKPEVCPGVTSPQYSNTKYFLTNPTGFGERDTIDFNYDVVDDYYLEQSLMDSIVGQSQIETSGPELTVKYKLNSTYTAFTDGYGYYGTNEVVIYWRVANLDTTVVHTFYSVYSKVKIN